MAKGFWYYISKSTLKREYAAILTSWVLWDATYLTLYGASDMQYKILELLVYPILIGSFGAFGLDWAAKQTHLTGPPIVDPAVRAAEQAAPGTDVKATTTTVEVTRSKNESPFS